MKNFLILTLIILVACTSAPSEADIQTAIANTQAAKPTETPFPLSSLNLEGILLLPGDLPQDFRSGQIKNSIPNELKEFDEMSSGAEQVIHLELREDIFASDGLLILLYDSMTTRDEAFKLITRSMEEESSKEEYKYYQSNDVGETAVVLEGNSPGFILTSGDILPSSNIFKIGFVRCHAVVYLGLFSPLADNETTFTYAKRLDDRLMPLVCNE